MAKPGRNDPCPCGSGNKYKKCCLAKEEAVAREQLVKAQAPRDTLRRDQRAAADRLQVTELTAAVAARLARAEEEDAYEDALDIASNAVVDLVRAAKLDEAEAAARDLLRSFPDAHDGWDRLGMVHEARGDSRQAADCYRKVIAFIRDHPDDSRKCSSNSWIASTRQPQPDRDTPVVMLHKGADHTTIAMHDQPARKPLSRA
jgi:tetratricopeptide (TPR) repeat protein